MNAMRVTVRALAASTASMRKPARGPSITTTCVPFMVGVAAAKAGTFDVRDHAHSSSQGDADRT
jgi:hypothetical protein